MTALLLRFVLILILFLDLSIPLQAWSMRKGLGVSTIAAFGFWSFSSETVAADRSSYSRSPSGIEYYDYRPGYGDNVKIGDKISFNYKGRLLGRQGWVFDDTFEEGKEPVRMTLGKTNCIEGLELGLAGDGQDGGMPAMKKGGKRRLVIPSRLGYTSQDQLPIPSEFAQKQRLYSTVLNSIRGEREREALGDSIVGKLVLDVELLRISRK